LSPERGGWGCLGCTVLAFAVVEVVLVCGVVVVPVPQACNNPAPAAAEQVRRKWRRVVEFIEVFLSLYVQTA